MPSGYDWPGEVKNTRDIKEMIKKVKELNEGLEGDLYRMSKNCHKALFEGDLSHRPMCFVKSRKTGEVYYICQKCLSKYAIEHPDLLDHIVILRGHLTEEAEEVVKKYWEEHPLEDEERYV